MALVAAAVQSGRAGAGVVLSFTPQPPPFPALTQPLGLRWAIVIPNGRSGRACGPQLRLRNALGPSFRLCPFAS